MQPPVHLGFVGVGPQRTASTWLDEMLRRHPSIALPSGVKETKFFDQHYRKGFAWYARHFEDAAASQIRGEVCPSYFDDDAARDRLKSAFPQLRVIVTLRNPVERAFSVYRLELTKGRATGGFRQAVAKIPRIITSGHYAEHGPRWESTFGPERVLYLLQEDIRAKPDEVLDRVYDFLGVPRVPMPDVAREDFSVTHVPRYPRLARLFSDTARLLRGHRFHWLVNLGKAAALDRVYRGGNAPDTLTPELRRELVQTFERDIAWVEEKLGRKFPDWRA
jgi:hypothetical protein